MKTDGIILRVIGTVGFFRCAAVVSAEFIHRDWTIPVAMAAMTIAAVLFLWTHE